MADLYANSATDDAKNRPLTCCRTMRHTARNGDHAAFGLVVDQNRHQVRTTTLHRNDRRQ